MEKVKELKPCPFCGGRAKLGFMHLADIANVTCDKCGAIVSFRGKESLNATRKQWNCRGWQRPDE